MYFWREINFVFLKGNSLCIFEGKITLLFWRENHFVFLKENSLYISEVKVTLYFWRKKHYVFLKEKSFCISEGKLTLYFWREIHFVFLKENLGCISERIINLYFRRKTFFVQVFFVPNNSRISEEKNSLSSTGKLFVYYPLYFRTKTSSFIYIKHLLKNQKMAPGKLTCSYHVVIVPISTNNYYKKRVNMVAPLHFWSTNDKSNIFIPHQ